MLPVSLAQRSFPSITSEESLEYRSEPPAVPVAFPRTPASRTPRSGNRWAAGPLAAAAFGIPWLFLSMIWAYANRGHTQAFDVIGMIPAWLGLIMGGLALRCGPMNGCEKLCWAAGMLGCVPYIYFLGSELLH